jgi:hypothetical protein
LPGRVCQGRARPALQPDRTSPPNAPRRLTAPRRSSSPSPPPADLSPHRSERGPLCSKDWPASQ